MKTCARCFISKPFEAFSKGPRYRDGYQSFCKQCMREYRAEQRADPAKLAKERQRTLDYYHQHRDTVAAKRREYDRKRWHSDAEHRSRKNQQSLDRYHNDPISHERKRQSHYRYYHSHYYADPEFRRARLDRGKVHVYRRRQIKRIAGKYSVGEWRALCAKYDHRCLCCGEQKPLTPDHIKPLSRGGTNTIDNIQPLCLDCNMHKATKETDYRPLWGGV